MLLTILAVLAALLVVFVLIVAARPSEFRITRSTSIAAPPESVFDLVNTLRQWESWNPWSKMDPTAKMTYDGPGSGAGASYAWAGNSKVGEGRNTIVESVSPERVRLKLEFFKPMKAVHAAEFTFQREGALTKVAWTMTGKNNFVGKAFTLFLNCDQMIGSQFEKGLAAMKDVAESRAANPQPILN